MQNAPGNRKFFEQFVPFAKTRRIVYVWECGDEVWGNVGFGKQTFSIFSNWDVFFS